MTKTSAIKEALQWIEAIVLAVIIAFLIRGFVFEPVYVEGASMENTLRTSQRLIVYKLGYYFKTPSKGDIVVLKYQEGLASKIPVLKDMPVVKRALPSLTEIDYIKRVIAVPGDRIDIPGDGYVYVNGEKIDEPYIKEQGSTYSGFLQMPIEVPEGMVFVMGDNRKNSRDSREIGLIELNRIKGKAVFVFWPLKDIGLIG